MRDDDLTLGRIRRLIAEEGGSLIREGSIDPSKLNATAQSESSGIIVSNKKAVWTDDVAGTCMASMYLASTGSPTHNSSGGYQKVGAGGGTGTWVSAWDVRPLGTSAQINTTDKRIDVIRDGIYMVEGTAGWSSLSNRWVLSIYVNGAEKLQAIVPPLSSNPRHTVMSPLPLLSGDYVELFAYQDESASEAYDSSEPYFNKLSITYMGLHPG